MVVYQEMGARTNFKNYKTKGGGRKCISFLQLF